MTDFEHVDGTPVRLENTRELIERFCYPEWKYVIDLYKSRRIHGKGDLIFREGEQIRVIHIIDSGKVKIFTSFNEHNERIVRLATDGNVIGHRGIGLDFIYSVSATALTEVHLTMIPIEVFKNVLRANNLFSYYFMLFFAEELKRAEKHVKDLASHTVIQRIARALIMNLEIFGFDKKDKTLLNYTLSRSDLAKLAGSTYETIIRNLKDFSVQGVIGLNGKKIHIINENKLREIAGDINKADPKSSGKTTL